MSKYIIGIDQSTQGTKALLFNEKAQLIARSDRPHQQKISLEGYISHSPEEIYENMLMVVKSLLDDTKIDKCLVKGIGICNQRETTVAWNKENGKPICDAIVWQCSRAKKICERIGTPYRDYIINNTGMPLSPYFSAGKMAWILENNLEAKQLMEENKLCFGTIDSWLLFKLTEGKEYKTDFSNASRTQLFNLHTLKWDKKICDMFGISMNSLPEVCDSNALFGFSNINGLLTRQVPIHAIMGDSHAALYGQRCHDKGMVKVTFGTGSSLMMNLGDEYISSKNGIVTSLAWGIDGKVNYVLEGNLNYTGAVIKWLKDDVKLIESEKDTEALAFAANQADTTYLIPAFSGLGAPYWKSDAKAMLYGMCRTTGRAEIVKAALDCIAYQITDVLLSMENDSGLKIQQLCVDGGPTKNHYLMQMQSNMAQATVKVPNVEELSGIGVAYMAGMALETFNSETAFSNLIYEEYHNNMMERKRSCLYDGWKKGIKKL